LITNGGINISINQFDVDDKALFNGVLAITKFIVNYLSMPPK